MAHAVKAASIFGFKYPEKNIFKLSINLKYNSNVNRETWGNVVLCIH